MGIVRLQAEQAPGQRRASGTLTQCLSQPCDGGFDAAPAQGLAAKRPKGQARRLNVRPERLPQHARVSIVATTTGNLPVDQQSYRFPYSRMVAVASSLQRQNVQGGWFDP